jgi:hypothetical protein
MSVREFLVDLTATGRVRVSRADLARVPTAAELAPILMDMDLAARVEMAGEAPPLSMPAASWAALALYQGCLALAHRDIDAELVRAALARPCPAPPSPWVCYSVDVVLRYLPDLIALARGIAPSDQLVVGLLDLARAWPLSSVGVSGVGKVSTDTFLEHPALKMLYVDRILERGDVARMEDPVVREAVREALGDHRQLAPAFAAALSREEKR